MLFSLSNWPYVVLLEECPQGQTCRSAKARPGINTMFLDANLEEQMKLYICSVPQSRAENYQIGMKERVWGVPGDHGDKMRRVRPGDRIAFVVAGSFRSVHEIESERYVDRTPIWPDGIYQFRIRISAPLASGCVAGSFLSRRISFMKDKKAWGGTLQGASGVFNDRATRADHDEIFAALESSNTETS